MPDIAGGAVIGQSTAISAKAAAANILKDNEEFGAKAAEYREKLLTDELKAKWDDLCVLVKANGEQEAEIAKVTGATIQNTENLRQELLIQFFAEYLFSPTEAGQAREIAFIRKYQETLAEQMKEAIPQIQQQLSAFRQQQLAADNMTPEELTAMLQRQGIPVQEVKMVPPGLRRG